MKNKGIIILKFLAALLITYSHMALLFPKYDFLVTGGIIGDGLFFFCSGYTLFLGRNDSFINWYKRRVNRIYPTVIAWALLSAIAFNWEWSVIDLITTPKYWFVPCIMVYYFIIYFLRHFFRSYLKLIFILSFLIVIGSSIYLFDFTNSVMYSSIPFMRVYCFLFMLLGAMQADGQQTESQLSSKHILYLLSSVISYYVCMYFYKIDPFYCKFQVVSLIPLLATIYWMYRIANTDKVKSILDAKIGRIISIISALTLEIYMVQYAIFTDKFNYLFPLNILGTFAVCFLLAYVLKCSTNIYTQIFNDSPFDWSKVYKI